MLLPLHDQPAEEPHLSMPSLIKELGMQKNANGADCSDCRCRNIWATYRDLRTPPRPAFGTSEASGISTKAGECSDSTLLSTHKAPLAVLPTTARQRVQACCR